MNSIKHQIPVNLRNEAPSLWERYLTVIQLRLSLIDTSLNVEVFIAVLLQNAVEEIRIYSKGLFFLEEMSVGR